MGSARASGQPQELADSVRELNAAEGPETYTALREIWRHWSDSDPAQVAHALRSAAESSRLPAPARAYAGFLAAHARTRFGDLSGAARSIRELGFVSDWLVVGPFDNEGKVGLDFDYGPEAQFGEAIVPGRAYSGKERAVRWRSAPKAFPHGWLDGSALMRPETHVCFYAWTFVANSSSRPRRASFWVGAAGAHTVFINGVQVLKEAAYRGHDVDRRAVVVELPSGVSRVTTKLCNEADAPLISLRVADEQGKPDPTLKISAEFSDAELSVKNYQQLKIVSADQGPLAEFEARTAGARATAAAFEAHARYLLLTHGDDSALHLARDLAHKAAEKEPTVERLLLAGELSEDFNTHRVWLDKAEALAGVGAKTSVPLLLARATVERGGLNWRDAFPYYERVLKLDQDNLEAIQGRVELYNEAGMARSALHLLQQAVTRQPKSVTLLNFLAGQLRKVGDVVAAEEVENRYAQCRFDDHAFISSKLDLALVRGERSLAEYWVDRLIALTPNSLWARGVAARAYRRLGQPARAIASLNDALLLAPEDVGTLRALSDLHGELGDKDEQLRLLRQILEIRPQAKEIAEYVQHIEPAARKQDEAYAWAPDRFLKDRHAPANGESRRTLLDLTVSTMFENGLSGQFRQIVFQPLVDSAAALSRNYSFQFQADSQRVQLRGAKVFRVDGRVDEAIETGIGAANDPSVAMYTSARTYYVQFPRLEPGDVVELQYRIDDVGNRNEFADYFGEIQHFQSSESVGHAEYVLITPKSRKLYIDSRGIPGLKREVTETAAQRIYRFTADRLAPILPEPAMPPWSEVLGFVHVSTYADYAALGKWYWGLAKDQFELDDETRRIAQNIVKGLTTEREKVAAVYNWVIQNTRYVALEFGIYGFKPRRCVQTVSRGWGDCKDKATVIVSLLKEVGIESTIVVIRTQMRGRFKSSVASLSPFDHAIAYVPSLDLYLDGTAEFTGIGELGAMDQGSTAILVNGGNSKLVTTPLSDPEKNLRRRVVSAALGADGKAKVTLEFETTGVHAPGWRSRYSASATQRERLLKDLGREFPGIEIAKDAKAVDVNVDDFEKPVRVDVRAVVPSFARVEGDRLSVPVTTRVRLSDDYASLSSRKLDVAVPIFGTQEDRFELTLPPGMRVLSGPLTVNHQTEFGDYSVVVKIEAGKVAVTSRVLLKQTRIAPAKYPAWRAFCEAVDAAMSPRLVIGK